MSRKASTSASVKFFKDIHFEAERAIDTAVALAMNKVPFVCERRANCALPDLVSRKFFVSPTMTVGTFAELLRKRIAQEVTEPFYLFIKDEVLKASGTLMQDLHRCYKDTVGFLFVTYCDTRS